jgi:hypothetical protein
MQKIALLFFGLFAPLLACAAENELNICDLQRPGSFSGRVIVVKGRLGFTSHGMFLLSNGNCSRKSEDIVVMLPHSSGVPAVSFELDGSALAMLRPYMRPTGGTATACGVINGELFSKKGLKVRREGGGPQGDGFGPRGAFSLGLVLKSIIEIRPCD